MPHLDSERITTRFLLGSLLLLPTVALGQDAPSQIVLSEPDRAADHGFTHVIGIFELRDGSVVVADNYDAAVYLVDRSWETTVQLGRTGAGPREYQHPAALFPLGGDSTAIKDPENDRLLIVRADGTLGGVLNRVLPSSSSSASPRQQWVEASDGAGHFFAQAQPVARDERGQLIVADSAAIERWAVGSTKRDTVAFVLNFFGGSSVVGGSVIGPGGRSIRSHRQSSGRLRRVVGSRSCIRIHTTWSSSNRMGRAEKAP